MADGLSVATAVIGVIDEAFALGKAVNDIVQDYRNAPAELGQIASDINVYGELMLPLAEQLQNGSVSYSQTFRQSVENMAKNSLDLFDDLEALMPKRKENGTLDKGMGAKLSYAFNKSKIAAQRKKLFEMRDTFRFIKESYQDQLRRPEIGGTSGLPHGEPVTLSGAGRDASGAAINYSVTLVVHPAQSSRPEPQAGAAEPREKTKARTKPVQSQRPKGYLTSLRQSPNFSVNLLTSRSLA